MDKLSDFTDEELKKELKRRQEEEEKRNRPRLKAKKDISIGALISACESYLDTIEEKREPEKQWVFEAAMEAIYTKEELWNWINKKCKEF